MPFSRPAFAFPQRRFGRGRTHVAADPASDKRNVIDDLRLFVVTFAAGFLFVSILIG